MANAKNFTSTEIEGFNRDEWAHTTPVLPNGEESGKSGGAAALPKYFESTGALKTPLGTLGNFQLRDDQSDKLNGTLYSRGKVQDDLHTVIEHMSTPKITSGMNADATAEDIAQLKKDIEDLRKRLHASAASPLPVNELERSLDSKYGPNATVTTKNGSLTIGGLVQSWYYADPEQDRIARDVPASEMLDASAFGVRRNELKFSFNANKLSVVNIEPARESTKLPEAWTAFLNHIRLRHSTVISSEAHLQPNDGRRFELLPIPQRA